MSRVVPSAPIGSARLVSELGLSPNDMQIIYRRHHGWEKVDYATLAMVFGVDRKVIARICRDHSNALHNEHAPSADPDKIEHGDASI